MLAKWGHDEAPSQYTHLTGGRADSSCEFGEIVRLQQLLECLSPIFLEDVVVPFWNDVAERASRVSLLKKINNY